MIRLVLHRGELSAPQLLDRLDDELDRYAQAAEPGHAVVVDTAWHKLWKPWLWRLLGAWATAQAGALAGLVAAAASSAAGAVVAAAGALVTGVLAAGGAGLAWLARREERHVAHCPTKPGRYRNEGTLRQS